MSGCSNDVGCDRTSAQSSITSPLWHVSVRTAPATSSGAASHCGKKDLGWLSQIRKTVRAPARKNTTSAHLSKSSLTCGPSSDRHWPEGNSALRIRITALITAGKSARAGEHPNPKGFGKGSTKSAGPEDGHPTPQGSDPPRVTGQRSTPRRDPASNWNQKTFESGRTCTIVTSQDNKKHRLWSQAADRKVEHARALFQYTVCVILTGTSSSNHGAEPELMESDCTRKQVNKFAFPSPGIGWLGPIGREARDLGQRTD